MPVSVHLDRVSIAYRRRVRPASFKARLIERIRGRGGWEPVDALRDVSLSVRAGETVGIVGANGAGKTSLLKVVAGTLPPSGGAVAVAGVATPVLGFGAGDPELTGRENVRLLGLLFGRGRREIDAQLEAVLAFADLGRAADATSGTYSLGMRQRLLLAVALAWRPDVLLLDEATSSADAAFAARCLARVREFASHGTASLLVSHDTAMLRRECERVVWLEHGRVRADGASAEVLRAYGIV